MVELKDAQEIAVIFVKEKKSVTDVRVIITEQKDGVWVVRGTCPIDLCGHPWSEDFVVEIDQRGRVTGSSFGLM